MYPIVSLFGLSLGTYGICCVIGGALAIWLAIRNGKRFQQDRFAMLEACVWALIGGFLGAKLLYLLVSFSDIVEMFQTSGFNWNTISSLLEGGFVFYGGLLGGLAALAALSASFSAALWGLSQQHHACRSACSCIWTNRLFLCRLLLRHSL